MACTLTATSSVLEAVECALELALQQHAFLNNSRIPLLVHQTWKTSDTNAWPNIIKESVEKWIRAAVQGGDEYLYGPQMAWFLWDDEGIDALVKKYEPVVEKAYVFRVVVLEWFGGVVSSTC